MTVLAAAVLLLLIVGPVQAQEPADALQAARDAGVAVVALLALPVTARYSYLMVRQVSDNAGAERAAGQRWFGDMAERYGLLKTAVSENSVRLEAMQLAVDAGKASADALAADVRELMSRIEPAVSAMTAIEQDIKRRDAKDAEQDSETRRLALALAGFTTEFHLLKRQIERGQTDAPTLIFAASDRDLAGWRIGRLSTGTDAGGATNEPGGDVD